MSDLIDRLRHVAASGHHARWVCEDAANTIEQQAGQISALTAEVARLNLYIDGMATIDANRALRNAQDFPKE